MTTLDNRLEDAAELRRRAEEIARGNADQSPENLAAMSLGETQRLLHELRVHQVELELQNEELRRAQRDVAASRAQYFALYDLAPVGYVTLSEQGLILQANLTVAALLGVSRGQLVEQLLSRFIVPEDIDTFYLHRKQLLETGAPQTQACELRMKKADGTAFWGHLVVTAARDAEGAAAFRVVLTDVTNRKQAEESLRTANMELEQAVARAEALAVRAEAANRAKSEFLNNMSHELRTPMTAILGCSELLIAGDLSPTAQCEFLQTIQHSGQGLLGIINDVLDLARIEADRLPLEKTDCVLRQILDDVMAMARITAAQKRLSLQVVHGPPLPATLYTDAARLRQILVNLVGNAVKFTEQGEVRLTVRCWKSSEGIARVQFVVSDTGIGIPSVMLDEIFRPFVQVDGTHTRRYGGTGLGLSICQRLAEALDGRIDVTSELGRGSTFTLTMDGGPWRESPSRDEPAEQPSGMLTSAEPGAAPTPVLQGRVLLVEDDPTLQLVIGHLLRRLKLEAEVAGDGQLACQMVERSRSEGRPYALILMDLRLPGMNGLAATRWLRTQGWSGPIVALTAHAMTGDRERCLAAGCDDYLSKPITSSGLREVLRRYLGQGQRS